MTKLSLRRPLPVILTFALAACFERPVVEVEDPVARPSRERGQSQAPVDELTHALSNTRPDYEPDKPLELIRLDLALDVSEMKLLAVQRVTSRIRPTSAYDGDYMLIARAGGRVLSAVPVQFPRTFHVERDTGPVQQRPESARHTRQQVRSRVRDAA